MKKMLDDTENEFPTPPVTIAQAVAEGTFMSYLNRTGWNAGTEESDYDWQWIRNHCLLDD